MLTREEVEIVYNRMREYPAGIGSEFWGFGPMATRLGYYCDTEVLFKYG